jgi:ribosomal protein S17
MTSIFVKLLDEEIDVWRPVEAMEIKDNLYKIISDSDKAYEEYDENWEFKTGDIVRCQYKKFPSEKEEFLVAIEVL